LIKIFNLGGILLRILLGFLCAASMAMGSTVYGTSADGELTGSRDSTSGDISVSGVFGTPFDISWVITPNGGLYQYVYTITGPSGSGLGVSHFALNLSADCVAGGSCVTNAEVNGSAVESGLTYGPNTSANGDTNFPGSFYGVRFFPADPTQLSITVQFDSDHGPVYGDFYLKRGQGGPDKGGSAWDNGCNPTSDTSGVITDYIPGPGDDPISAEAVPEPATFFLSGISLIGLGLLLRRSTASPL
jgi:hypothetical protein